MTSKFVSDLYNKSMDERLQEVEDILHHIEGKIPKGYISRESEAYGCWLDIQEELETLKEMEPDHEYLKYANGIISTRDSSEDRIAYKLDIYYDVKSIDEAMEIERNTPAPKTKSKQYEER